jgi:hypothetical protein
MAVVIGVVSVVYVLGGVLIIRRCRHPHPTLPADAWHRTRYWAAIAGVSLAVSGVVALRTMTWYSLPIGLVAALIARAVFASQSARIIQESYRDHDL